jgi:hypothetical protein
MLRRQCEVIHKQAEIDRFCYDFQQLRKVRGIRLKFSPTNIKITLLSICKPLIQQVFHLAQQQIESLGLLSQSIYRQDNPIYKTSTDDLEAVDFAIYAVNKSRREARLTNLSNCPE